MKKKYTNPRLLLKAEEEPVYDLMLRTSQLLPIIANEGIAELHKLMVDEVNPLPSPISVEARDGLHKMLTYAFTLGVSFAVARQVEIAATALRHAMDTGKAKPLKVVPPEDS